MTTRTRGQRFTVSLVLDRRPVLSLVAADVIEAEEEGAALLGVTARAIFARELGPVRPPHRPRHVLDRQP